jgi:hypothetical protein
MNVVLASQEAEIQVKLLAKDRQGVVFMEIKSHRFYYILFSAVNSLKKCFFFVFGATAASWPGPPHSRGF